MTFSTMSADDAMEWLELHSFENYQQIINFETDVIQRLCKNGNSELLNRFKVEKEWFENSDPQYRI